MERNGYGCIIGGTKYKHELLLQSISLKMFRQVTRQTCFTDMPFLPYFHTNWWGRGCFKIICTYLDIFACVLINTDQNNFKCIKYN